MPSEFRGITTSLWAEELPTAWPPVQADQREMLQNLLELLLTRDDFVCETRPSHVKRRLPILRLIRHVGYMVRPVPVNPAII